MFWERLGAVFPEASPETCCEPCGFENAEIGDEVEEAPRLPNKLWFCAAAPPNMFELDGGFEVAALGSIGFIEPKILLELCCAALLRGLAAAADAGVACDDEPCSVFTPPNRPEVCCGLLLPNNEIAGAPVALSPAGGGPAGVVEIFVKLKAPNLFGAGVDVPAVEDEAIVGAGLPKRLFGIVFSPLAPNGFVGFDVSPAVLESEVLFGVESAENMLLLLLPAPPAEGLLPVLAPPHPSFAPFILEPAAEFPGVVLKRPVPEDCAAELLAPNA